MAAGPLVDGCFLFLTQKATTAHRGANGAAMPTDEGDQDGRFFYNHPARGGYLAA